MSSRAPYKSRYLDFYAYEKNMVARLKDSRFDFLFQPGDYTDQNSKLDLHDLLAEWIGNKERLTILNLRGVPPEVLDITVG